MFIKQCFTQPTETSDQLVSKTPKARHGADNPIATHNLSIIKVLSQAKFPVYLTSSKANDKNYVMKIFPHTEEGLSQNFTNEIRFSSLNHPNIIDILHCESHKEILQRNNTKKVSSITMEHASHGDFFDFILKHKDQIDDKLARTYFRQLIHGLEYLHGKGIAHLDIKPENLLLGSDFNLKIADFDLSYMYGDNKILSKGTKYYRAPEFFSAHGSSDSEIKLEIPFAADIYSAGVFLYLIKSGGVYPHFEEAVVGNVDFADLLYSNNRKFWTKHCDIEDKKKSFYDDNFKTLFNGMMKLQPQERLTIRQIKESKWFNGAVYSPVELREKMKKLLRC